MIIDWPTMLIVFISSLSLTFMFCEIYKDFCAIEKEMKALNHYTKLLYKGLEK